MSDTDFWSSLPLDTTMYYFPPTPPESPFDFAFPIETPPETPFSDHPNVDPPQNPPSEQQPTQNIIPQDTTRLDGPASLPQHENFGLEDAVEEWACKTWGLDNREVEGMETYVRYLMGEEGQFEESFAGALEVGEGIGYEGDLGIEWDDAVRMWDEAVREWEETVEGAAATTQVEGWGEGVEDFFCAQTQ
ncbi:hypothetical protein P153DRAFT_391023 [Dothidotthia symphoricarpi CBS 119687]|uniref:Uncharacterized protein n=1 Tax=Dothidotthia symphoricarpi CBS 119687 TaxID=1392245 RepID=A0A6A5ZZ03_9PLEO|nr:uncharacterized protein P153DRAFT_391023 [Dothidotthia symphoricarpi CBS 119687]KAF2123987.1 hypothetical protein P153DRAFT_391023 [Dothidotthia symphoricarpi CBS 119687]